MNINKYLPAFRNEFEKTSFLGAAIMGGMTMLDLANTSATNSQTAKLNPPQSGGESYQLKPSYEYQFEGGKHLPTKPVTSLNSAFIGTEY